MLLEVLRCAESWAVLIPLITSLIRRPTSRPLRIVVVYLCIAFVLNTMANISILFYYQLSGFLKYNNWEYNLHSLTKTVCFVLFFQSIGVKSKWLSSYWVIVFFLFGSAFIFLFIDDFFLISSKVFALEGLILLVYCMYFFFQKLKDEQVDMDFDPFLVIVTGLSIYESVNFFVFLFFDVLMTKAVAFAGSIWDFHNVIYIVFCLFLTYAFYGRTRLLYR